MTMFSVCIFTIIAFKMKESDSHCNSQNMFSKQKKTLINKTYELFQKYDAKVYLFIDHEYRVFAFNSVEDKF